MVMKDVVVMKSRKSQGREFALIRCRTILSHMRLYSIQGTKSISYFTEEQNPNFTEDCLGGDKGSTATRVSSQTVLSKIRILLQGQI